ncbi:PREDICTED: leucine-rich repeat, partial [Prunus dulcis]
MINLSYNQFCGRIPNEYGARIGASWKALYLDNNFLQGRLSPELIANPEKKKIKGNLSSNCLRCQEILP